MNSEVSGGDVGSMLRPSLVEGDLSVAVKRISDVIEVLAEAPQGATYPEVAASLKLGRQAVSRLLDAMVLNGLAEKDETSKRYRLGLRMYRWGSAAVARVVPPPYVRYEIAELAEEVLHPVFYAVLDGAHVVTVERTARRGRQTLTSPDFRRNPWYATSSGRALAAFLAPAVLETLLQGEERDRPARKVMEDDLESVRHQGYAASDPVREGYTLAAPVLDETGLSVAAIGIGVNKQVPDEREVIIQKLLDTANRVSSHAGYGALLLNA
jgi:IclR family KDG regulon transcriptional repressor